MNISDTNKIIDNASDKFESEILNIQKALHEKIEKLIFNFNSSNGRILNVKENHQHVVQIKSFTNRLLEENGFNTKVSDLLESLNDLNDNAVKVQKKVNALDVDKKVLSPMQKRFQKSFFTSIKEAKINGEFTEPIRQLLFDTVSQGGNVGDAQKRLRDLMLGEKGKKGIISRWAGQVSRDALGQYNGLVNNTIRKEYKLAGYLYVGNLVEDSRSQCAKWLDKGFIKYEDLDKELAWALNKGTYQGKKASGMVRSTTKDTFATYRGGYNCRHEAIASNEPEEENKLPPIETNLKEVDEDTLYVLNSLKKMGINIKPLQEQNFGGNKGFHGKKYDAIIEGILFELKLAKKPTALQNRLRKSFEMSEEIVKEIPSKNIFKQKTRSVIEIIGQVDAKEVARTIDGQMKNWRRNKPREIKELWILNKQTIVKFTPPDLSTYEGILEKAKRLTN